MKTPAMHLFVMEGPFGVSKPSFGTVLESCHVDLGVLFWLYLNKCGLICSELLLLRPRLSIITIVLFVDSAPRAASTLKNQAFPILCMSSKRWNSFIWLDLSITNMLEVPVLKNGVECTSQRLKWWLELKNNHFWSFSQKLSFSFYWSVGRVLQLSVWKNAF